MADAPPTDTQLWTMVHAERRRLATDLSTLSAAEWARPSLCAAWTVEEVLAHLTAAASLGRVAWIRSVLGARFDFDRHNARRMAEHRGVDPAETLRRFRAVVDATVAPMRMTAAWLGEVVVHGQDIRRPLRLSTAPSIPAATAVARCFAGRDFTVNGRRAIAGLRVEAVDGPFAIGDGDLVRGTTIALVMAMAGRVAYVEDLEGPGVSTLRDRCPG